MYIEGQGTQKDIGKGINYFASSAEKGSAGGYFALGTIYLELFRDYSCAFPLYEKSVVILSNEASSLPTGIFISQEDKNKRERVIKAIAAFKEALNLLINLKELNLPLGFTLKSKLLLTEVEKIKPNPNQLLSSTSKTDGLGDKFLEMLNPTNEISPLKKIIDSCTKQSIINIIPTKELEQLSNNDLIELAKENGLEKELILDSYGKLRNKERIVELFSYFCNQGYIKNEYGCTKIPKNARQTSESSWECGSHFKQSGNFCINIPLNASASGDGNWKCNSGYVKSGYGCNKIPKNASASSESSWKCNSGYIRSEGKCAKIPDNASATSKSSWKCNSGYYKNGNVCLILPSNAFASDDVGWKCNSGYYKNDRACIPLNASVSGESSWKCNSGYIRSAGRCAKIPENASATGESSWKCHSDYVRSGNVCSKIPDNASASSESSWKCNSDYIRSGKSCAKIPENASASSESSWKCNPPFEKSGNFCITIPLNASASGNGGWECDSGSIKIGDICKVQQVKNLHFHSIGKNIDELDFSSTNFCDLSPKAQLRNNNFYLPNQEKPYSGKNLCIYLLNGQYYSSGDIKEGLRQDNWTYWHQNGQKMAEGLYLDGVPAAGQWNFWDENGSQESNNIQINVREIKVNTTKTSIDDTSTNKIDYESEKYLGQLSYCAGMISTINPDMGEAGKQIYIIVFEELFPDSDIKNIVKKGFDLGKREYAALEFAADFDQAMSNAEERARVSENCSRLSTQFLESMEGVGGYRP